MGRLPRMANISSWARKKTLYAAGGVAALLIFGWAVTRAQSPGVANTTTTQGTVQTGTVQSFTTAPRGEVDGAVLTDGTRIHWPPHMQDRFRNIIAAGDQVRATGRTETGLPAIRISRFKV